MRGTGPQKELNNSKGGGKKVVEEKEVAEWDLLADRCLEYTVFRGLKGERVSVDCPKVRYYQSIPAPLLLHVD